MSCLNYSFVIHLFPIQLEITKPTKLADQIPCDPANLLQCILPSGHHHQAAARTQSCQDTEGVCAECSSDLDSTISLKAD